MAKRSSTDLKRRDDATPDDRLRACIARLDPATQKLVLSIRAALRKRLPSANELAYDYASSLVVCYSPSDRGIEGIVSFAARADGVRLYFMNGPRLPDPKGLLQGSGKDTRYVVVDSARRLADPAIESLLAAAIRVAAVPLPTSGKGALIMKDGGARKTQKAQKAQKAQKGKKASTKGALGEKPRAKSGTKTRPTRAKPRRA